MVTNFVTIDSYLPGKAITPAEWENYVARASWDNIFICRHRVSLRATMCWDWCNHWVIGAEMVLGPPENFKQFLFFETDFALSHFKEARNFDRLYLIYWHSRSSVEWKSVQIVTRLPIELILLCMPVSAYDPQSSTDIWDVRIRFSSCWHRFYQ